jgi:hypothetical protein
LCESDLEVSGVELEMLSDESANVEEVVAVTLSESVVNLNSSGVCGIQEVSYQKLLLLRELVIRAQVNEDRSFGSLPALDQESGIKLGTCLN